MTVNISDVLGQIYLINYSQGPTLLSVNGKGLYSVICTGCRLSNCWYNMRVYCKLHSVPLGGHAVKVTKSH